MDTQAKKRRTGLTVGGAIVTLLAATVLAVAGVVLWTDVDKRDGSGYLSTNAHHYATSTRAIATDEVTIGTEIPKSLIGKVRLQASSAKPVFVGIARKATVDAYLAGASYATAKDLDLDPFKVTYVTHSGSASPGRPGAQTFWAASAVGADTGTGQLTWKPKSGSWSIVVMNADGSPGVSADVTAGARVAWLLWAGIGIALVGFLILAGAVVMLARGLRGPRVRAAGAAPAPAV
jgi:hypothetical protein